MTLSTHPPRCGLRRAVLLAILPLASCATPFPVVEAAPHAQSTLRFPAAEPEAKATLRMILAFRGMELPVTLRVWRRMPHDLRLIAADDLGGTLFHVVWQDATQTVIQQSQALPAELLTKHIVPDLVRCLTLAPQATDQLVLDPGGRLGYRRRVGSEVVLFRGIDSAPSVRTIDAGIAGELISTTALSWSEDTLEEAQITNHRAGYRLELFVQEWRAAALSDKTFRTRKPKTEKR